MWQQLMQDVSRGGEVVLKLCWHSPLELDALTMAASLFGHLQLERVHPY
jgi:phosphoheptose isomerase